MDRPGEGVRLKGSERPHAGFLGVVVIVAPKMAPGSGQTVCSRGWGKWCRALPYPPPCRRGTVRFPLPALIGIPHPPQTGGVKELPQLALPLPAWYNPDPGTSLDGGGIVEAILMPPPSAVGLSPAQGYSSSFHAGALRPSPGCRLSFPCGNAATRLGPLPPLSRGPEWSGRPGLTVRGAGWRRLPRVSWRGERAASCPGWRSHVLMRALAGRARCRRVKGERSNARAELWPFARGPGMGAAPSPCKKGRARG